MSCLLQGVTLTWGASKLRLCIPSRPKPIHSIELITTRKTDVDVFEIQLSDNSKIDGLQIRDLALPPDSLIIAIIRDDQIIPPKGHTVLKKGDILFVIAAQDNVERISEILSK